MPNQKLKTMDELSKRYFSVITKMIKENKTTKELEKPKKINRKFIPPIINKKR